MKITINQQMDWLRSYFYLVFCSEIKHAHCQENANNHETERVYLIVCS